MLLVFWAHVSVPSICGRTWSICLFVGGLGVLFSWVVLLQLAGACLSSMLRTQAWLVELDVPHVFVHWSGDALKTADFCTHLVCRIFFNKQIHSILGGFSTFEFSVF
jgi:hypothetical protein